MEDYILEWIPANPFVAIIFSIFLNILVAILGIVPSAAITAANLIVFGFNDGLAVSIAGEAAGAIASFLLYRKGLGTLSFKQKTHKSKFLLRLKNTSGAEAILLVLTLRILPFIPSGAVTLAAAYSKMGLLTFSVVSTIGKIPSLLIEAYSVNQLLLQTSEFQLSVLLLLFIGAGIYYLVKRK